MNNLVENGVHTGEATTKITSKANKRVKELQ